MRSSIWQCPYQWTAVACQRSIYLPITLSVARRVGPLGVCHLFDIALPEVWGPRGYPVQLQREEVDHGQLVDNLQPRELLHRAGLEREDTDGMRQATPKLANLPKRDVLLERVLQPKRSPEVVRVHHHMRQGVGPCAIADRAARDIVPEEEAPDHADSRMMVDVQERELPSVPLHEDPQGVEPIQELREVMHEDEPLALTVEGGVDAEEVREPQSRRQTPDHIRANDNLHDIVDLHRALHLERLPRRHVACHRVDAAYPDDGQDKDHTRVQQQLHPSFGMEQHGARKSRSEGAAGGLPKRCS